METHKLRMSLILPLLTGLLLIVFPFSMAEDALFKRILVKARATSHNYMPPTRYQVAGPLLDANFAAYQKDALDMLLADVETLL